MLSDQYLMKVNGNNMIWEDAPEIIKVQATL